MEIRVIWEPKVKENFGELSICIGVINNVRNTKENEEVNRLRLSVYEEVKANFNIETLKDNAIVRAYRDFYWKLGIDPTKTRPSGEALLRRVLHGDELPKISTVVDAYNLASMKTIVPISGFDKDCLNPPFHVRFARKGESFMGIGMNKPAILNDNALVLTDGKQVLCIYPYRDADYTKITETTENVLLICYGAPEITSETLLDAMNLTLSYIQTVAGGNIETVKVFS